MHQYKDLGDQSEDERIRQIGEHTMSAKLTVGFFTDDEEGKAARYISKLQERYPGIRVVDQKKGPIAGTVFVKVAPPIQ
jgi:hypothetical protein